jgi:hypothetical protein
MGFFENELQKIFGKNSPIKDARFVGRACVGRLDETTNVKLEFITLGTHEKYEAIKATILNRKEGVIDSNIFRFADMLGKNVQKLNDNKDKPYCWSYDGKHEWYGYKPTITDYAAVANEVNNYLEIFLEHEQSPQKMKRLYLLYSCNEWCEKSKAELHFITSDKNTLYAAIGGEILTGNIEYLGISGGKGFAAYKKDLLAGNDVLREIKYGFIREMKESLLSEPKTLHEYYEEAGEYLAADFKFSPAEFDRAYESLRTDYGDDGLDEEHDDEI